MTDQKILPMEKRQKIHRKASNKCAEVLRESGAAFVYMAVLVPGNGGMHMVDAYSGDGKMIPDIPSFLLSLAQAHQAQDTDVSKGDIGWKQ